MTTRAVRQPSVTFRPATVLTVLALGLLAVCAAFAAVGLQNATTLLLGMLFVIPAVLNLPLAVIIWVPFAFLPPLGFVGAAPTAGAAVILLAWLPSLRARGAATRALLTLHRRTILLALALLVWLTVSLSWAEQTHHGLTHLWQWWFGGVRVPRVDHDDLDAAAGAIVRPGPDHRRPALGAHRHPRPIAQHPL